MADGVRGGPADKGETGAVDTSSGTRLDRTRVGGFRGGPSVWSIAVAGRAGVPDGAARIGQGLPSPRVATRLARLHPDRRPVLQVGDVLVVDEQE